MLSWIGYIKHEVACHLKDEQELPTGLTTFFSTIMWTLNSIVLHISVILLLYIVWINIRLYYFTQKNYSVSVTLWQCLTVYFAHLWQHLFWCSSNTFVLTVCRTLIQAQKFSPKLVNQVPDDLKYTFVTFACIRGRRAFKSRPKDGSSFLCWGKFIKTVGFTSWLWSSIISFTSRACLSSESLIVITSLHYWLNVLL